MKKIIFIFFLTALWFVMENQRKSANTSEFIEYKNTRIHYIKSGHGKKILLFVHGLPLDARSWQCQLNYFQKKYTVIAIDLPGYGLSSPLASASIPNLSQFYSDAINHVLEQLQIREVVYIGFATGGHVGIRFATEHADKISQLILINTSPKFTISENWPYGFDKITQEKIIKQIETGNFNETIKMLLDVATQENCPEKISALRASFSNMAMSTNQTTLLSFFNNIANEDFRNFLPQIKAPTLIITGSLDKEVPPAVGLYMRKEIPNAEIIELYDKDHFLFATAVSLVNQNIENFIQPQCETCAFS